MGSLAIAGKLAVVEIGDIKPPSLPTTWTEITEVYEIGDINVNRGMYDATYHGDSIYRAQMVGLADAMSIQLSCNYVETQYKTFWDLANDSAADGPLEWFRIRWPDGYWHRFEAFVGGVSSQTPLDERITYQVTLACTQDFYYENVWPPA